MLTSRPFLKHIAGHLWPGLATSRVHIKLVAYPSEQDFWVRQQGLVPSESTEKLVIWLYISCYFNMSLNMVGNVCENWPRKSGKSGIKNGGVINWFSASKIGRDRRISRDCLDPTISFHLCNRHLYIFRSNTRLTMINTTDSLTKPQMKGTSAVTAQTVGCLTLNSALRKPSRAT